MENYRIELLLKINEEHTLLTSEEKVLDLLKLNSNFKFENDNTLVFKEEAFKFFVSAESENIYSIAIHTIASPGDHLVLTGLLTLLTEAARELKITILSNLKNCGCEVLWDDVGIYYAQLAFPKIINIENLMRKLITKFMLVSVGMDFFENIPEDINLRSDTDSDSGFLHNIDFIDLTKYLFTARPLKRQEELMKIIDSLQENVLPDGVNLLNYKKDSYWNRYFKNIVGDDIDAASIKNKWEQLYKYRCKIAHSKFLKKGECEDVHKICRELDKTFSAALEKLKDIRLSEENKRTISEDIFSELEGEFWHEKLYELIERNFQDEFTTNDLYVFEPLLQERYPQNSTIRASIRRNLQKLRDDGKIEFVARGRYKINRIP